MQLKREGAEVFFTNTSKVPGYFTTHKAIQTSFTLLNPKEPMDQRKLMLVRDPN